MRHFVRGFRHYLQMKFKCHQSALRRQFHTLKCTKIVFGWGSAPHPAGGAHIAPLDPLAEIGEGDGKEGKGRRGEDRGEGGGRGRRGEKGKSDPQILKRRYAYECTCTCACGLYRDTVL
jgi:hypothetical protein